MEKEPDLYDEIERLQKDLKHRNDILDSIRKVLIRKYSLRETIERIEKRIKE